MPCNVGILPTALKTSQYRLIEVPDETFLEEITTAASTSTVSRGKRSREDELSDNTGSAVTFGLKASGSGAAIVTSRGQSFNLRRVAYSNSLFLTQQDASEVLQSIPEEKKREEGGGDGEDGGGVPGASSTTTPVFIGQELIPALYECNIRPPRFDMIATYLNASPLTLEEMETPENAPTLSLKTWDELCAETVASEQEIRQYLVQRGALIYNGYVRCVEHSSLDSAVGTVLTIIEARSESIPWEDIPFDLFFSPGAKNSIGIPVELVALALRKLGMKSSNSGVTTNGSETFSLDQERVVSVCGEIVLRRAAERAPNKTNLKKELLLQWQKIVPHGMQPLCEIESLVNDFSKLRVKDAGRPRAALTTLTPAEGVIYVDVDVLSFDPRERLRQLFKITPRILSVELKPFFHPLFYIPSSNSSADATSIVPQQIPEMDNVITRSCREHKGKLGRFFSME